MWLLGLGVQLCGQALHSSGKARVGSVEGGRMWDGLGLVSEYDSDGSCNALMLVDGWLFLYIGSRT